MTGFNLIQKSNLDRDVIFNISTDVENFHKIMPKYFKSLKIISDSLNEKVDEAEEVVKKLKLKLNILL